MTETIQRRRDLRRPTPEGVMRHRGIAKGRAFAVVARWIGAVLAVTLVSGVAIVSIVVTSATSHIRTGTQLVQADGQIAPPPQVGAIDGSANILLAGTDTRTGQGGAFGTQDQLDGSSGTGSNDVTMVLHISADHSSATVISIPRDLEAPVPECPDPSGGTFSAQSKAMFNTTLSEGGLSCVVLTAEQLTGLSIQYAATIDFDGVIAMSDAIGGVTVCLDAAVDDPSSGLNLPAGNQSLAGATALAFLRTRNGVGDGSDLGRISNQQVFLAALARQVLNQGVLSNPIALYKLADAAVKSIQPSTSLAAPTAMVSLALALKNVKPENIVFLQYPVVADPENNNRVVPNDSAASDLKAALAADAPLQLTGSLGVGATSDPVPVVVVPSIPSPLKAAAGPSPSVMDPLRVPTATPTPVVAAAPVALPSSISGQTAAQSTCSRANN